MNSIFNHDSYKTFIKDELNSDRWPSGTQSRLAEKIRCQTSFLSRVLNREDHLTPEQALRCTDFFGLNRAEEEYFVALLSRDRAGDEPLRVHYDRCVRTLREGQWNLSALIDKKEGLDTSAARRYYSTWYYSAIHVAVGVAGYQTIDQLSQKLQLDSGLVAGTLQFLEQHNLVTQDSGFYNITKKRLHLSSLSELSAQNHINWRFKAIDMLNEYQGRGNTNFSSFLAVSKDVVQDFRRLMIKTVKDVEALVGVEGADDLVVFNLDFFHIGKS